MINLGPGKNKKDEVGYMLVSGCRAYFDQFEDNAPAVGNEATDEVETVEERVEDAETDQDGRVGRAEAVTVASMQRSAREDDRRGDGAAAVEEVAPTVAEMDLAGGLEEGEEGVEDPQQPGEAGVEVPLQPSDTRDAMERVGRDTACADVGVGGVDLACNLQQRTEKDVEASKNAEVEAKRKEAAEAAKLADEEAKRKEAAEASKLADEEAKRKEAAEASKLTDEEAKRKEAAEAAKLADEEAKRKEAADAQKAAEEEAQKAENDAMILEDQGVQRRADVEPIQSAADDRIGREEHMTVAADRGEDGVGPWRRERQKEEEEKRKEAEATERLRKKKQLDEERR
ncbi:unnamed protein product [Closterium sp. NIES-64]|nr:unnamed protein product [Closterium sp. NIES-64]